MPDTPPGRDRSVALVVHRRPGREPGDSCSQEQPKALSEGYDFGEQPSGGCLWIEIRWWQNGRLIHEEFSGIRMTRALIVRPSTPGTSARTSRQLAATWFDGRSEVSSSTPAVHNDRHVLSANFRGNIRYVTDASSAGSVRLTSEQWNLEQGASF